ncbi:hypothetical protein DPMN_119846 [Dreissena polymorpha]|uniref:Uncharacterized protein n=1 Tax=Dreissena polymorpha TaxID=45954 RepID=A0A9D4GJH7_DREPO|nr:hypothetical protein DPMN_119846 [Dreissena polymorpha]
MKRNFFPSFKDHQTFQKETSRINNTKGKPPQAHHKKVKTSTAVDSDNDIESEEEKCCGCGKFYPEKSDYDHIKIVQWGQCDTCNKWVLLKFCTRVKVLRRGDSFLCPTCCKAEK